MHKKYQSSLRLSGVFGIATHIILLSKDTLSNATSGHPAVSLSWDTLAAFCFLSSAVIKTIAKQQYGNPKANKRLFRLIGWTGAAGNIIWSGSGWAKGEFGSAAGMGQTISGIGLFVSTIITAEMKDRPKDLTHAATFRRRIAKSLYNNVSRHSLRVAACVSLPSFLFAMRTAFVTHDSWMKIALGCAIVSTCFSQMSVKNPEADQPLKL